MILLLDILKSAILSAGQYKVKYYLSLITLSFDLSFINDEISVRIMSIQRLNFILVTTAT